MIVENAEYQAPPAAADGFLRFARATGLAEQIEAAAVRGKKVGRTMLVALASPIENRQGREHGRSIPFCDSLGAAAQGCVAPAPSIVLVCIMP